MADESKTSRPEARLPKGFRDIEAAEIRAQGRMIAKLAEVFERYGYEPLETPAFEYTDALGKFLPDSDRPNEGVFSIQDEDEQWMSLRYDMTAPLARYVAQNFDRLPKPYRRFTYGPVWRNEKPGPGRFRQFMQFDADTVGTESVAADAEACMLMADAVEALGIPRGQYRIKVNNRKVLDGVREALGLASADQNATWLTVMRALDKFDKFGAEGVRLLLGAGRKDESGDFTKGAGLDEPAIMRLVQLLNLRQPVVAQVGPNGRYNSTINTGRDPLNPLGRTLTTTISSVMRQFVEAEAQPRRDVRELRLLEDGLRELEAIGELIAAAGYDDGRIIIDPSVVRGLDYYTGPVFEAELTFPVKNEDGEVVRFGSVGGGGRYDDLVARFTGQRVPATGFSIGVSRLAAALASLGKAEGAGASGPVVVLVMDRAELPRYQKLAATLRAAGIRAEMYLGTSGMKPQMKYADRRGAPCVVIQGSNEREQGVVQIKDLVEGAKAATRIADSKEWREGRPAQFSVPEADMVEAVKSVLARHGR